jgi:iron complex transport system permease protein
MPPASTTPLRSTTPARAALLPGGLALLALLAAALGLSSGPYGIDGASLIAAWHGETAASSVVLQLRLPRVVLALLVGAALAQSGAAMQGLVRNPLADPGLLGVSSGAALMAAGSYLLLPQWGLAIHTLLMNLAALVGGLAAGLLALKMGRSQGQTRVATLLLGGLAINALAAAGIGLMVSVAEPDHLRQLSAWTFGSLARAGWAEIALAAPLLLLAMAWLQGQAATLDRLLLGDAEALHLGVDVRTARKRLLFAIVLVVAISTALTGLIGFVGLLVPQGIRLLLGPAHRRLMFSAALAGAALLALADLGCRRLAAPQELPIGVLTALVGAPCFLLALMRGRQRLDLV